MKGMDKREFVIFDKKDWKAKRKSDGTEADLLLAFTQGLCYNI